jgi:MFS family permease
MALFMSYPFLALYLDNLKFNALEIGIILGCHYFFAGVVGVGGGSFASRGNPKWILAATLLIGAFAFFCLGHAQTFLIFILSNCCLAIATSTFEPVASMQITVYVPRELHALAFRYRYMAINIGAAIGPLIGTWLILLGARLSFFITSALLSIYSLLFLFFKTERQIEEGRSTSSMGNLGKALRHMSGNHPFLFLMAANLCVTMTYGQIFSTLPLILSAKMEGGRYLYSILLMTNSITVITTGLLLNAFLTKQPLKFLLKGGALLLGISFLGFHFCPLTYLNYILCMIFFTLAEVALIPTTSKFLFDLAPEVHRGAYLGSESSSYLGFFLGNLIGGWFLKNGYEVFIFCTLSALSGYVFYHISCKKHLLARREDSVPSSYTALR